MTAVVRLPLPDGMAWMFLVDGQAMYPADLWPSTDGGTVIEVRYDIEDQSQQDAMVAMAEKFLDDIRANQIVKTGDSGGASAVDDALNYAKAAREAWTALVDQLKKTGSDIDEIDTSLLDPTTAALVDRISNRMDKDVGPGLPQISADIDGIIDELGG